MTRNVNMRHVRTSRQKKLYEKIAKASVCSFCVDFCKGERPTFHPKPILWEGEYWAVTKNSEPYKGSRLHLLLVYKRHKVSPKNLPAEAMREFGRHLSWVLQKYKLPAGAFYARFGNTNYTGASIRHLHFNIIIGGSKKGEPLRVKLGYVG